jgi:predicted phage terminase large subunit-like protein
MDYLVPRDKDVHMEWASRNLMDFITYTKPDYEVNWHHKYICERLDLFLQPDSGVDRLIIEAPPRSGKSEIVSRRFPAYALGKNPKHEIVLASYASPLAQRMNRDVQRIMDDELYAEVFPDTNLNSSNVAKSSKGNWIRTSDLFEVVGHGGSFRSTGVNGSLTGQGLTIGIIDDPIKDWKEATSKTIKDGVWEWYQSVFYTRLNPRFGKIIVMNTRWAEDDLTGRLLAIAEKDDEADQWEVLRFPMIQEKTTYTHPEDPREVGELLWPDRFDKKKVTSFKKTLGSRIFGAMYQQRPAPDEGGLVQRDWWKYYKKAPNLDDLDYISISWDFTFKGGTKSDYVVGQVWGRKGANYYLLDQVRDQMNFSSTVMAVKALARKWSTYREIVVEEKANGAAVIDTLKSEIRGIVPYSPKESKEARASSITPNIEAGNVWLPDPELAPWVMDYVEEWAVFPNGANDDQIDCTSQMLIRFAKSKTFLEVLSTEEELWHEEEQKTNIMDTFWGNKSKNGLLDF